MDIEEKLSNMADEQESIVVKIAKHLKTTSNIIRKYVSALDFSDYVALETSLNKGDFNKVVAILGISNAISEADNPYQVKTTTTNVKPITTNSSTQKIKPGDTVKFKDDTGKDDAGTLNSISGNSATIKKDDGSTERKNTDELSPIDQQELQQLKNLAGIKEMTSGAITSGAMAGVMMPMNKLKKLTHVKKKPGPKTGK
jgi:transcription antitermination factor NusG